MKKNTLLLFVALMFIPAEVQSAPYCLQETPAGYGTICKVSIDIPTASEIGAAVGKEVKEAIAQGVKDALIEIRHDSARREAEIYKRMIELHRESGAQLNDLRVTNAKLTAALTAAVKPTSNQSTQNR